MFDYGFPSHWSTLKKLIWLKASALASAVYETVTGAIATFTTLRAARLKALSVAIEAVQSGTGDPSPDNVRPISGWTGAKIYRTGKNLLPALTEAQTSRQVTATPNADGSISLSGTATGGNAFIVPFDNIPVKAGPSVLHGSGNANIQVILRENNSSGPSIVYATENNNIFTFDKDYTVCLVYRIASGTDTDGITLYPMLEVGDTAHDYVPYGGTEIDVEFTTPPGTVYGGTLDVLTGVLTVTWAKWTNFHNWTMHASGYFQSVAGATGKKPGQKNVACDIAKTIATSVISTTINAVCGRDSDGRIFIHPPSTVTTKEEFETFMDGHYVIYELDEPQTYQLTPQEVSTLLGENNVWADTGDVTLTYRSN